VLKGKRQNSFCGDNALAEGGKHMTAWQQFSVSSEYKSINPHRLFFPVLSEASGLVTVIKIHLTVAGFFF
jgi:hypothetical protein